MKSIFMNEDGPPLSSLLLGEQPTPSVTGSSENR